MNKKYFVMIITATTLISCDGLLRSEFQNEYIKKCEAEGKFSSKRCECFAEKADVKFSEKTKQLILNPYDNPLKLLSLIKPLNDISNQCISEGR